MRPSSRSTCSNLLLISLVSTVWLARRSFGQEVSTSSIPSNNEISKLKTDAEAGNAEAEFNLARAYEDGNGVPQNDRLAAKWYRDAAEKGNANAQASLGLLYRTGRGVDQDKVEAVKWYSKAAAQGNATAMFNLGTAYFNGDGVGIDDVKAYAWFLLAQDFGSEPAKAAVNRMGDQSRNHESDALAMVGHMYEKGDDLPQSSRNAVYWYRRAAQQKDASPETDIALASLLLHGVVGPPEFPAIHQLCERAAKQGFAPAAYCLGLLYQDGSGVPKDIKQAAKWFQNAASQGHPMAMMRIGQMYWKGEGVKQDKVTAYAYLLLASGTFPEAKQQTDLLEKELTAKQMEKAKSEAREFAAQNRSVVLRVTNGSQ
jgi:TPR repeat protein